MKVSIVTPVYNAEDFLSRAIDSVLAQTYKDFELVLVNNGATDSSGAICDRYATADNRVRVITLQGNKGAAGGRNEGLRHATGELVFFLDADDYIETDAIEVMVERYKESYPDMVMSNFSKLENNGKLVEQAVTFRPIVDYVRHFLKYPSNHPVGYCWAKLYKMSIIKEHGLLFNENIKMFEDYLFNLKYLSHTNSVVFVSRSLYTYVMHAQHKSASMAILDTDSVLRDMVVFREETSEYLRKANVGADVVKKATSHAIIYSVIIVIIRSCWQVNGQNKERIQNEISKMVNAPLFRESLRYYSPSKGNSRIIPLLARLKLVDLIIPYCRHRALKRYGRIGGQK